MTIIDFIENDIARAGRHPARRLWALGVALAAACVGAAFALREDFDGVFTLAYLGPSALMLAGLAAYPTLAARGGWRAFWIGAALVLALSCLHPGFPFGTSYATDALFWHETLRCFGKGLATSLVVGTALATALFRLLPLPGRAWQLATSVVAGLAGVVMLNLHCASAHVAHIALGHWAQALPVLAVTFAWQRWLFVRQVRRALAGTGGAVGNFGRLDRGGSQFTP